MKPRLVRAHVRSALSDWPAVVLIGPRQCGKTTLGRALSSSYFDLERNEDRVRLDATWDQAVGGRRLLVLDEAQSWPELFFRLRGAIDDDRKRVGRFLLTGSVSPALMRDVAESLAGRLAIVQMSPFLLPELTLAERRRHWLVGGFPDGGILEPRLFPEWQRNYVSLLVQRDLPNWGMSGRPRETERLLRMLALSHGQVWNASRIGQSLGASYHTVNAHMDYLEGAFLLRRLLPYHGNLGKRLVKAPKLYVRDSGVLHALLGVSTREDLLAQPWVGASWEGYVIESVLSMLTTAGRRHEAYYLRTSDGYEIDLVIDLEGERWAIEVKLTTAPSPTDVAKLERTAKLVDASRAAVVCGRHVGGRASRVLVTDLEHLMRAI